MKCLVKVWRASGQCGYPQQWLAARTHRRELADMPPHPPRHSLVCCYCQLWVVCRPPLADITIFFFFPPSPARRAPRRALFLQPWLRLCAKLLDLSLSRRCSGPEGSRYCRASCGLTGRPSGGGEGCPALRRRNGIWEKPCFSSLTLPRLIIYLGFLRVGARNILTEYQRRKAISFFFFRVLCSNFEKVHLGNVVPMN